MSTIDDGETEEGLFRPSRPDFIETLKNRMPETASPYCSGLLGRTSLRRELGRHPLEPEGHCSGLLGRTSLRPPIALHVLTSRAIVPAF